MLRTSTAPSRPGWVATSSPPSKHLRISSRSPCYGCRMALFGLPQPSLEPDWSPDDAVLATAEIGAESVTIRNVRNISYRTKTDYDVHYYDKTLDLAKLESVWYMVEPFGLFTVGTAHTLVSFGFSDGEYVAI